MKIFLGTVAALLLIASVQAQDNADQNPNFVVSRTKYMAQRDSLVSNQGTTLQQTYKAYDWSQMREDRAFNRGQNRDNRRLARAQAPQIYYAPLMGGWNNPYPWFPRARFSSGLWRFWW